MVADDAQHVGLVGLVAREGAKRAGHLRRGGIGDARHDGRQRAADGAALGAVVGDARGHQAAADVGKARGRACGSDRRARRSCARGTAPSDRDFQRNRPQPAGVLVGGDVEALIRAPRNIIRLREARLQAVSSRNMYSEHGLEARIGPDFGQVCQSLMVVWNWMPGSARGPGRIADPVPEVAGLERLDGLAAEARGQRPVAVLLDARCRNSSVTRTELLEFWPETVR